eukprot:2985580-Amphidinium_carterae.2
MAVSLTITTISTLYDQKHKLTFEAATVQHGFVGMVAVSVHGEMPDLATLVSGCNCNAKRSQPQDCHSDHGVLH